MDATTGESGNEARDKRMQNEVLESNRYPAIFFHPSQIKGEFVTQEGMQELVGVGTFNIHGADHPLELPLKVQVAAGVVTATTKFTVPYVAWGMKDPSKFLLRVGKQVEIEVTAKGTLKKWNNLDTPVLINGTQTTPKESQGMTPRRAPKNAGSSAFYM